MVRHAYISTVLIGGVVTFAFILYAGKTTFRLN
jgi:hypothetical protein